MILWDVHTHIKDIYLITSIYLIDMLFILYSFIFMLLAFWSFERAQHIQWYQLRTQRYNSYIVNHLNVFILSFSLLLCPILKSVLIHLRHVQMCSVALCSIRYRLWRWSDSLDDHLFIKTRLKFVIIQTRSSDYF